MRTRRCYLLPLCILLMFFFTKIVMAQEITLTNEIIHFNKYKDFDLQGFTVTDKYIVAVLISDDENESIIKLFDKKTFMEVNSIYGGSLGHANDVAYNTNNNLIYVIDNGNKDVHLFDANTLEYIKTIESDIELRSLTYINDKGYFLARNITTGYILDDNLKLLKEKPFIWGLNISSKVARQGWASWKDKLYYATWSWIRMGGDGTNTIYVYDLNGRKENELVIDKDAGELEDVAFLDDNILLGFNGYDNYVAFYLEKIEPNEKRTILEINDEDEILETDKKNNYSYGIILGIILLLIIIMSLFCLKKKSR